MKLVTTLSLILIAASFASKVTVGHGQYRNAVASGHSCASINEEYRITRRYRVAVLTSSKHGSDFWGKAIAAWPTFPLRGQDYRTTDEPNFKSVNGFSGYLTLDDYPHDHVQRWLDPVEIATLRAMPTMKRGKTMGAFVELMGCKQNAQGMCNARVNYTIFKPDGSTFATRALSRRAFLWKKQAPSAGRSSPKGLARMHFKFGKDDPAGEYKVTAMVADLNADISFEIELNFYLR